MENIKKFLQHKEIVKITLNRVEDALAQEVAKKLYADKNINKQELIDLVGKKTYKKAKQCLKEAKEMEEEIRKELRAIFGEDKQNG